MEQIANFCPVNEEEKKEEKEMSPFPDQLI